MKVRLKDQKKTSQTTLPMQTYRYWLRPWWKNTCSYGENENDERVSSKNLQFSEFLGYYIFDARIKNEFFLIDFPIETSIKEFKPAFTKNNDCEHRDKSEFKTIWNHQTTRRLMHKISFPILFCKCKTFWKKLSLGYSGIWVSISRWINVDNTSQIFWTTQLLRHGSNFKENQSIFLF